MNSLTLQFLKRPLTTGAVCPSSKALAKVVCSGIGLETAGTVAEFGPGTGALTGTVRQLMKPGSRYFAVELNESMISMFKSRFPKETVYRDSAENLPEILSEKEKRPYVDVIVSGLPFASFPAGVQDSILRAAAESLRDDGTFTTFAYLQGVLLPAGKRFRRQLDRFFRKVEVTETVWMNFPPAFSYHCWK